MAPPLTTTLIDDFNRSNGAIGAAYTALGGGFNVSSNQIVGTSGTNVVYRNDTTPPADCEAVITVPTVPGVGQTVQLFLRYNTSTNNGYQIAVNRQATSNYRWYIYRVDAGATTLLGTYVDGQSFAAGDRIGFQIIGSALKGYRYTSSAWSEVISRTDANHTGAGRLMIGVTGTTAQLDDLYGGPATLDLTPSKANQAHTADAPGATFEAGGGGTVDVTPSEAAQTHTADAPARAAIYVLTPSKATQAHTSDVAGPPITSIKLGVIGDSNLDEYRADDARGGVYASVTFSPIEMLYRVLGSGVVNPGSWGTRGEPRRTGYEYNWARSAVTAGGVHSGTYGQGDIISNGMHTGLAAQVSAGSVDTVLIWVGSNDYSPGNGTYTEIYNGSVSGSELTAKETSILDNLETALDAVRAESGSLRVILANFADPGELAQVQATYPNATYRQRVTDSINRVNAAVDDLIAARSNVALMDYANYWDIIDAEYPISGGEFEIAGEVIEFISMGDEPHNSNLADNHFGTVVSAILANLFIIDVLNDAFGLSLTRMTDAEIVAEIGITTEEATPSEASQSHTADAPGAAFVIARTPGEAAQAHTADKPTVSTIYPLTPAEAVQAHSADSPTARGIYLLTPAEAAQAHLSDAPSVFFQVPGASVTPAKATQQHTSDAPNVTALYLLTPAEANQGHTADSPTATYQAPGAYATPSEASQSHSADSPTARAIYRLTAGEAAQTHTSDAPGVTAIQPTAQATPGEAVQAHSADSPAVYAVYAVTPGRSTQAHTADSPAASILLAVTAIVALTVLIRDGRLQVRGRDDGLTVGPRSTVLEVKSK